VHAQSSLVDELTEVPCGDVINALQTVAPGLKVRVGGGTDTPTQQKDEESWDQVSPPLTGEPGAWADDADSDDTRVDGADPHDEGSVNADSDDLGGSAAGAAGAAGAAEDDGEDKDAVMLLLSLHNIPSQSRVSRPPPSAGSKRRAESPPDEDEDGASRPQMLDDSKFFCRYPGCGKGYASTDAVRKHCRQRHLEWLRTLGHGCPQLYCHWGPL